MAWLNGKPVVLPIDFSADSQRAIEVAKTLVDDVRQLRPLYVAPVLSAAEPGVVWEVIAEETRAKHVKEEFGRDFGQLLPGITIEVLFGDPGVEIADFAKKEGAGLIVMPSHGRTGVSRLLIGSVAERVVRLAHCPVLVLRQ